MLGPRLLQIRTKEVASFEEFQRYFVDSSLAPIKFEIPSRSSEQDSVCSFLVYLRPAPLVVERQPHAAPGSFDRAAACDLSPSA